MIRLLFITTLIWCTACTTGTGTPVETPERPTPTLRALPTHTLTPALLTPLPTDTPLPTPTLIPTATPVAYIIQSGDTLISIAIIHNVSLEAIEAANPGINPVNLQLGQTIFIPPPSGEAAPNQAIAPTPLPVVIGSFVCSPTPVASLICLSEFMNTSDQPIANLAVKVTLLNSDHTPGDSAIAYSPLDLIPVGASVPLGAVFNGGSQRGAIGSPITADSGTALSELYATFTVTDAQQLTTEGAFTLQGSVTNTTTSALNSVVIVATVYNAASEVLGFRKIPVAETLAAGESVVFTVALPGVTNVARWQVIAQGRTR